MWRTNVSKCFEQNEIDCIDLMWTKGKLLKHDYYEENCQSDCPLECYTDSIDVSLSSTELIPKYYLDYLKSKHTNLSDDFLSNQIDAETAKTSFVYVNIFYKSLSFEVSTEYPQMSPITLISNIASNLSLFLGVSVFSLFEFVQVLIEIIYLKCNEGSNKPLQNLTI